MLVYDWWPDLITDRILNITEGCYLALDCIYVRSYVEIEQTLWAMYLDDPLAFFGNRGVFEKF